jgi:hypothetical protein
LSELSKLEQVLNPQMLSRLKEQLTHERHVAHQGRQRLLTELSKLQASHESTKMQVREPTECVFVAVALALMVPCSMCGQLSAAAERLTNTTYTSAATPNPGHSPLPCCSLLVRPAAHRPMVRAPPMGRSELVATKKELAVALERVDEMELAHEFEQVHLRYLTRL